MFELDIVRDFSAAHVLKDYQGACANLHGHNWTVQVFVRSPELDQVGIALDFKILKRELEAILAEYDHKFLNELPDFQEGNPTSERIAMIIYKRLSKIVNKGAVRIFKVRVCESPTSGASYFEE